MKRWTVMVAVLAAHGCALMIPGEATNAKMRSWMGHNIRDVIAAWGPPTSQSVDEAGGTYQWEWVGNTRAETGWGARNPELVTDVCRQWFTVDANRVIVAWRWRGRC